MKFMPRAARIPSQLWLVFATLIGGTFLLSDLAPKPSKAANHPDVADLGATAATAHHAMIEIFRNRNPTAIRATRSKYHRRTIRPEGVRGRGRQFPDGKRHDLPHARGWRHRHASFEVRRPARLRGAGDRLRPVSLQGRKNRRTLGRARPRGWPQSVRPYPGRWSDRCG